MATLQEHLSAFIERLDKELARPQLDTTAIGGLTKLGAALEGLLKSVYRAAAAQQRPPKALPHPLPTGPGQWLKALRGLSIPINADPALRALLHDASEIRKT